MRAMQRGEKMVVTSRLLALCLALAAMPHFPEASGSLSNAFIGGRPLASTCTPGELFCSDTCREVQFCGDAGPVLVDPCNDDAVCSYVTGTCVEGDVCVKPPGQEFACHTQGVLPDPYDCTRYHQCAQSPSIGTNMVCAEGKAFDSLTGRCSLPLDSRPCREGPVPQCTAPGQVGAQSENPNIYYVCVRDSFNGVIAPWLYKCDAGQEFVGDRCVPVAPTTAYTGPPTATTARTTPSTASTTTNTTPGSTAFTCPSRGQFVDPSDCRKYFLCGSDLQANPFTCQNGYHYDAVKGCVQGLC